MLLNIFSLVLTAAALSPYSPVQSSRRQIRNVIGIPAQYAAAADHSLIDNVECSELRKVCVQQKSTDNIAVLECIAQFTTQQLEAIPEKCQHAIWQQQRVMLTPDWLKKNILGLGSGSGSGKAPCEAQHDKLATCLNAIEVWPCINEHAEQLEHGNACRKHVKRIYSTLLVDYDSLGEFFGACGPTIELLQCGRLNVGQQPIAQQKTAECLQENEHNNKNDGGVVPKACKTALVRIEQQRADLELSEICMNDLRRLCAKERIGTPGAFKCLVKHKNHASLSRKCSKQISQRDIAIGHDYRQSRGLARACKEDIKTHHCRRGVSEDKQVRLAQILLCLESVTKNGTRLTPECHGEIDDHRRMLMEDYQLSPELLSDCGDDIARFCGGDVEKINGGGGEIIHCLMQHAAARVKRPKSARVAAQCLRSIETLIKVSDVGEDWRVDPVLQRACKPVVDEACSDTDGGEARVMSCLMERIGAPVMRPDCEQALLLIQYFVARDFKLDPQLFKHCHHDAVIHCRAKRVWDDSADTQMDPERGPLILPCLHRIAYNDDPTLTLRPDCFKEVKRVMRQRAISVDLMPEVEDVCLDDLSKFCTERIERGAEMECLQNNLEKLDSGCQKAVVTYTEEEAAHIELNPVIMSVCVEAMRTHCGHIESGSKGKGDMMECLISHKNDADLRQDTKCRAAIEHFQIISLKDYHFTYKFKEACRLSVARFCAASTTKNEVIACLSEIMRNDTIRDQQKTIPKECRQQVRSQLFQQRESVAFDPKLARACRNELQDLCANEKGPGQALECLSLNTPRLGNACHHAIFSIKKSELRDSATDYILVNTCKEMTYKYCADKDSSNLLDCLKTYKDDPLFDQRCHLVIVNRMIEQNSDFRFNPALQLACGKNIDQYCSSIVVTAQPNEELNGRVIHCLKDQFRENRLDPVCAEEMIKILQEQALNYRLNPLLENFCRKEIEVLCKQHLNRIEEHGLVEECLKTAFLSQKIINPQCKMEVATLIAEGKADIHVDPILEEACTVDLLRYCGNSKPGNGRKLKCLQKILRSQPSSMEEDCRLKLQRRMEMFQNADTVLRSPPESMQQLAELVTTSPARRYLVVLLMTAVGMIFIMGIFLGRVTKRAMNIKNK